MLKTRFLLILICLPVFLFGQATTQIQLTESENLEVDVAKGLSRVKKPVFVHQGAIMTCDSAHYWKEKNYFEAFGNVRINQDTINISSDLLNYNGNTKDAHLIRNVRMSDPSSILTTNIFYYNTATRIGRYLTNGKIQNKEATVTSKRGYYFASSNDAYFRENVVVVTNQVTVKSDTLRYNTNTNETYFYGPTDLFGKTDTLYTENGQYNTKTQRFFAGKNNLYTQNTKTLRGDSLYYDGIKGYGKAVRNIVFTDSQDQLELHGQLGEYFKESEKVRVTDRAYVALSTQDSISVNGKKVADTLWLGAKVLEAEMMLQSKLKLVAKPVVIADEEIGKDPDPVPLPPLPGSIPKVSDSVAIQKNKIADSLNIKGLSPVDSLKLLNLKLPDSLHLLTQSTLDSLKQWKLKLPDSVKNLTQAKLDVLKQFNKFPLDTNKVIQANPADSLISVVTKTVDSTTKLTSPKIQEVIDPKVINIPKDSLKAAPVDTVKTRIIRAYEGTKIFKSNLQAKADSLFFAAADSTLRLYREPIIWSDSTQLYGDTIHVQIRGKKIDNAQLFQNAFIASQQTDTAKFNQIKGSVITAFFEEGEIRDMYVDGNSESVVYEKNEKQQYSSNQTVSARIRLLFKNKELHEIHAIKVMAGDFTTAEAGASNIILTDFIWKPELRPLDKKEITGVIKPAQIPVKGKASTATKTPTKAPVKTPVKTTAKPDTKPTAKPVTKPEAKPEAKPAAKPAA
ncbi:MAG: hypothetical protein EOO99_04760 [Pedobacter sp.]|nr:MAG: hypothetical protein EOO99_04760 [Pedobacter sp.]